MGLCCARWLLVAFTVSVISACGSESVPIPVLAESLADKRWIVIQANDNQGQEISVIRQQIDLGNPFWFRLGSELLGLYQGCNLWTSEHTYSGTEIFLETRPIHSTAVACNFPEYRAEALELHNGGATWRFLDPEEQMLELTGSDGDVFVFREATADFCPASAIPSAFSPCP